LFDGKANTSSRTVVQQQRVTRGGIINILGNILPDTKIYSITRLHDAPLVFGFFYGFQSAVSIRVYTVMIVCVYF